MTRKRFEKLMMSTGVSPVVVRMVTRGMIEARRDYEAHKEGVDYCRSYEESFNRIICPALRGCERYCRRKKCST